MAAGAEPRKVYRILVNRSGKNFAPRAYIYAESSSPTDSFAFPPNFLTSPCLSSFAILTSFSVSVLSLKFFETTCSSLALCDTGGL